MHDPQKCALAPEMRNAKNASMFTTKLLAALLSSRLRLLLAGVVQAALSPIAVLSYHLGLLGGLAARAAGGAAPVRVTFTREISLPVFAGALSRELCLFL